MTGFEMLSKGTPLLLASVLLGGGCDGERGQLAPDQGARGDAVSEESRPAEGEPNKPEIVEPKAEEPEAPAPELPLILKGFDHPDTVIHDPEADVYLLSNIGTGPGVEDRSGFISRISPRGEILARKWVDGERMPEAYSPKGMALIDSWLIVNNIESTQFVSRERGSLRMDRAGGAERYDAAIIDNEKRLIQTDARREDEGPELGKEPTVYVTEGHEHFGEMGRGLDSPFGVLEWKRGPQHPRGLALRGDALLLVTLEGGLWELQYQSYGEHGLTDGWRATVERLGSKKGNPKQLEGIVVLDDGRLLVSSVETGTVYEVSPDGMQWKALIEQLPGPGGIGLDRKRQRLLIPCMTSDELRVHQL